MKSDCVLFKGEFVNRRVLLALFMQLCQFTLPVSFVFNEKKYLTTKLQTSKNFLVHVPDKYAKQAITAIYTISPAKAFKMTLINLSLRGGILRENCFVCVQFRKLSCSSQKRVMYGEQSSFRMRKSRKQRDRCWPIFVPNQRQAFE